MLDRPSYAEQRLNVDIYCKGRDTSQYASIDSWSLTVYTSSQAFSQGEGWHLDAARLTVAGGQAPPEEAKPLYLQYAALEERYGLARAAMEVYDRAVRTVPESERLGLYQLYVSRASEFFGIGKVCGN